MTQEQREAISSPASGLTVYQTDGASGLYTFGGSEWGSVTTSSDNTFSQISAPSPTGLTYFEAIRYCAQLEENGFNDWRLGTKEEWESLFENSSDSPTEVTWLKGDFLVRPSTTYGIVSHYFIRPEGYVSYTTGDQKYSCHCIR